MVLTRDQEKAMFAKQKKSKVFSTKDLIVPTPRTKIVPITPKLEEPINYITANRRFQEFLEKSKLEGFSFVPELNRGFDFKNLNDAKRFHRMFVEPKNSDNPVYTIAFTNQLTLTDTRELHSNFEFAQGKGFNPIFGFFTDELGRKFSDITIPVSGISLNEAIKLGKEYKQKSISVIFKNGQFDVIPIE